jgi:hypothetical protein
MDKSMKATLKFDLSDPDDRMDHLRAIKSTNMAIVLFEISNNISKVIYDDIAEGKIKDPAEALDKLYDKIFDEFNIYGIDLDELLK